MGERAGFRGGTLLDLKGTLQLLSASHLRERDRGLLRGILSGRVWNGFLLGHARGVIVPCRFCGEADGDGHLFWDCTHPLFVHIRENPEFHGLLSRDKSTWPRCLVWHGWLPALASAGGDSPWADSVQDILYNKLHCAYGAYTDNILYDWNVDQHFLDTLESSVLADPDVWKDGSLVTDDLTGIASGGAGVFAHTSGSSWFGRKWGLLDLLPRDGDLGVERCTLFDSLPGPLQTVQRAELWGLFWLCKELLRYIWGLTILM